MENATKIDFRQERNFSELISATFVFFKQEYRNLNRPVFYILAFLALASFVGVDYFYYYYSQLNSSEQASTTGYSYSLLDALLSWPYIIKSFLFLLFSLIIEILAYSYIKEYVDSAGQPDPVNVKRIIYSHLAPSLGWGVVTTLLIIVAFFFLIIPGIFLSIALILTITSIFFDNDRQDWPLDRSFSLVKGHWWITLALYVIMLCFNYFLQLILSVPFIILMGLNQFNMGFPLIQLGFFYYIYYDLVEAAMLITNIFMATMLAFHYFNLVERKEMLSVIDRIENITIED